MYLKCIKFLLYFLLPTNFLSTKYICYSMLLCFLLLVKWLFPYLVKDLRKINDIRTYIPDGGCKEIGGSLSNQIFSWISDFSNTCVALHYHNETRVLLDSCKTAVIWKPSLLFFKLLFRRQNWLSLYSTSHSQ